MPSRHNRLYTIILSRIRRLYFSCLLPSLPLASISRAGEYAEGAARLEELFTGEDGTEGKMEQKGTGLHCLHQHCQPCRFLHHRVTLHHDSQEYDCVELPFLQAVTLQLLHRRHFPPFPLPRFQSAEEVAVEGAVTATPPTSHPSFAE